MSLQLQLDRVLAGREPRSIRNMPAGPYDDTIFRDVDGHGRPIGAETNGIEAFAVEAAKGT
jgi:hypothetical protein